MPTARQIAAARHAVVTKLSMLDTFKINGRAIGDCTPEEALAWREARARDNRFVDLLVTGCPPGQPIRQFIKGDEADALYARVQTEQGNQ